MNYKWHESVSKIRFEKSEAQLQHRDTSINILGLSCYSKPGVPHEQTVIRRLWRNDRVSVRKWFGCTWWNIQVLVVGVENGSSCTSGRKWFTCPIGPWTSLTFKFNKHTPSLTLHYQKGVKPEEQLTFQFYKFFHCWGSDLLLYLSLLKPKFFSESKGIPGQKQWLKKSPLWKH